MAKVINKGIFRVTHSVCNSLIEFSYDELTDRTTMDYTGGVDSYKVIECPACREKIYFNPFDINRYKIQS